MNIIESEIRQIFASIVWNHKIHENIVILILFGLMF